MMLRYEPCRILGKLLIDLSLATDVTSDSDWPVFWTRKPGTPEDLIAIQDTAPVTEGRTHVDGVSQQHYGCQITVRGRNPGAAYSKIMEIQRQFDTAVRNTTVVIDAGFPVIVHAITRASGPVPLGTEQPESILYLYTLNVLVSLTQTQV